MPAAKGSVPWNAGTSTGWTDKRGYRWVYVTENGKRRARREHRVIVEKTIGRRLEPWEVVHHKDSNPSNNAISNLEVIESGVHTTEHHTGSRKTYEARRRMEAFALMREELKAERALSADLMEALKGLMAYFESGNSVPVSQATIKANSAEVIACRAAIAKAEGEQA